MLRRREYILVAALLAAAVWATGALRLRLDGIVAPFRDSFRSMLYLPRGDALKIMAAGFDAPAADALFVKALVYIPQAAEETRLRGGDEAKLYVHELFDVVTDLSPRFYRAYQVGSLYLTASSSLEVNLQGVALLEKGVEVYDRLEREGKADTITADPRWLFHSLIATAQEVNIQSGRRNRGDIEGAARAREAAAEHFRLAASSPDAPEYIIAAANGFESTLRGQGDIEVARAAVLSVRMETYNQAVERGDEELAKRLEGSVEAARRELEAIVVTRQLQTLLSQAGERYLKAKGTPAENVTDLHRAGFIAADPAGWPLDGLADGTFPDVVEGERDTMRALPDGGFRSRILSRMETMEHLELLLDAVIRHRRFHQGQSPETLDGLVADGLLAALPKPPLAALGQEYIYDNVSGATRTTRNELLDAPPMSFAPPSSDDGADADADTDTEE